VQLYCFLWVSLMSFAAITLCVASQRVFIVVRVYLVIDSVRKLLDTPSYTATAVNSTGRVSCRIMFACILILIVYVTNHLFPNRTKPFPSAKLSNFNMYITIDFSNPHGRFVFWQQSFNLVAELFVVNAKPILPIRGSTDWTSLCKGMQSSCGTKSRSRVNVA
jgi:hypothetical protein